MKLRLINMNAEEEEYTSGCSHNPSFRLRTVWTLTWEGEDVELYEYNVPDEVAKTLSIGYEREWAVLAA